MAKSFPVVSLAQVLIYRKEFIQIKDEEKYKRCRVQLNAKGIVLRDTPTGADIKTKKQQVCRAGELLVAEIDAKVGGFGVVPESLNGAIVSSHYFLFSLNGEILDKKYLDYFIRTPQFREQVSAQGSTNYAAIRPYEVLDYTLPLPPISEQQRIVARIEELAAKIEEARVLRRQAAAQANVLIAQTISKELSEEKWKYERLGKILSEPPRNGLAPQQEAESGGRPMLRINAVSSTATRYVDLSAFKMVDVSDEASEPFTLRDEDVFIVRYNGDINRVAKAAIFKSAEPCNIVFPDKLMRLRPDRSKMLPDFLVYALGCRRVRTQVEELGKTTAGQIGVSGSNAKSFEVPMPPISEQYRIVSVLDNLQTKVDCLKNLQAETATELDALMPAILDKAFKGEL